MVFDWMVPPGYIGERSGYESAAALVGVSTTFKAQYRPLHFESTQRRFLLLVEDTFITFRGMVYGEELERKASSRPDLRSHLALHNIGLHQFKHIDLTIVYNVEGSYISSFHHLLENILHILSATKTQVVTIPQT
jgi:hypothetical protein